MDETPVKSLQEILATGIKHAGGLAQLAEAEKQAEARQAARSSAELIAPPSPTTSK